MDTIPVQIRTLFAPTVPSQASAVLFLIENSDRMASIWSDVRDYCLKPLLSEFDEANRNAPVCIHFDDTPADLTILQIKVFAVESQPDSPAGLPDADRESPNGLHHGLGNIRFNNSPANRISSASVDAAIDVCRLIFLLLAHRILSLSSCWLQLFTICRVDISNRS